MQNNKSMIIAIGASTDDSDALEFLLTNLPAEFPHPIVVTQHCLPENAEYFAKSTNEISQIKVRIAENNTSPQKATAYIAATNEHLIVNERGRFEYTEKPTDMVFRPSIDILFSSLSKNSYFKGMAFLMANTCEDGFEGLLQLKNKGWQTILINHNNNAKATKSALSQSIASKVHILSDIPRILIDNSLKLIKS